MSVTPTANSDLGSFYLVPNYAVRIGDSFDITLVHTLGKFPATAGDRFLFERREHRWIAPQFTDPEVPNYVTARATSGAHLALSATPRNYSAYTDTPTFAIVVEVAAGELKTGDTLTVTIHNPQVVQPVAMSTVAFPTTVKFFLRREIDGQAYYAPDTADLCIIAGPMDHLSIHLPGGVATGGEFTAHLDARDAFDNLADSYYGKLAIDTGDERLLQVELTQGRAVLDATADEPGIYYLTARDLSSGRQTVSNPMRVGEPDELQVYFGDIHGKVFFCGGTCDVDQYYHYAREVARLDFSAITGVSELFRHHCTGYRDARPPLTDSNWAELQRAARQYTVDDEFAAFLSFEWQSDWKPELIPDSFDHIEAAAAKSFGDRNVYYLNDDEPFFLPFDEVSNTAGKLFDCLRGKDALVIPHHSSAPEDFGGVGLKGADWTDRDDELMRLVEIYSKWGCSEYSGCPRKLTNHSQGRFVQDALAMGHRLGFIGSSDTHLSIPGGSGVEGGGALRYYRPGYACVYAPRLTKQDLFAGLRARRCYATTGVKILLDFYLNERPMGTELELEPTAPRHLEGYVAGTAPIESVEVVRNGRTVHTQLGDGGAVLEFAWTDASDMREYAFEASGRAPFTYYYLRVIQRDWEMAWSSPVWVDMA